MGRRRTEALLPAEAQALGNLHISSECVYYESDAGKDWGQEEKGAPEDEIVGWHH